MTSSWSTILPSRHDLKENKGARNHFMARGGDLVYLVRLVCLVYLVRRTGEIRQTRASDNPLGGVVRCLPGQLNIHHSTLSIPPSPLPSRSDGPGPP